MITIMTLIIDTTQSRTRETRVRLVIKSDNGITDVYYILMIP